MSKTFKETVKNIRKSEKDVDKVLNAAHLQRTPREHISADDKVALITMGAFMICVMFIYALFFLCLR